MKRSIVLTIACLVLASGQAWGQYDECSGQATELQDGCNKAIDLSRYMLPQLGIAITGGNTTLAQGGSLGGLGNFAVTLRSNAVFGSLPLVSEQAVSTTGPQSSSYTTEGQILPLPAIDVAVGVFKGLPLGLTNVGGIDVLLSASYIPAYSGDNVEVETPGGSFKIGYGARVGLLQETLLVPGVSASIFFRGIPTVNVLAAVGSDSVTVRNLNIDTRAWRITASKNFIVFGLAAGVGQDTYEGTGQAAALLTTPITQSASVALKEKFTRTNYFLDAYFSMLLVKFVGEIGMVSGGDISTYNSFDEPADKSRLYGAIGLRVGL